MSAETIPASMATMALKARQQDAYEAIATAYRKGIRRQLVALPTGVGKTVLGAHVARRFHRVLFMVPREELLAQTETTMLRVTGRRPGVYWKRREELDQQVTVGMIQTIHARLGKLDPAQFDLIIVDECHHAGARTWREALDYFTPDLRLGLSATPERNDGTPLSNLFDDVVYRMSVAEAVEEGYLCRPVGLQVLTSASLDGVKTTAGDLNARQLEDEVNTPERNALVARTYHQHAKGRRSIAFCVGVAHAQAMAATMLASGIRAEWVSGDDPDRVEKVAKLRRGAIDVLCNAMLLTEGFDDPTVACILMARPTKSKPLYCQAVGRGLRLAPGKLDCLIIDFVDATKRHSLAQVWDWYGKRLREAPGQLVDLSSKSKRDAEQRVELAAQQMHLLFGVDLNAEVFLREVDLLKAAPSIDDISYGDRRWHYDPPTEKQLAALERMGYDVVGQDWTKGQASLAMGSAPASDKQLKLLLACGYDVLTQAWSRSQAAAVLDSGEIQPDWKRVGALQVGRKRR